jgi:hypothetical protein
MFSSLFECRDGTCIITTAVVLPENAAMGPGWDGTAGEACAKSSKLTLDAEPNSLLFRLFRVVA